MKYLVQVSYINPSHEHVSLRRRVDTVNRIVEAANEEQAILRVSRQQRALGFMVKEANVVKPKAINEDVNESSISYNKPKPKNTDGWSTPKPKPRHTDGWSTPKPKKDAGSLIPFVPRLSAADPKRYTQKDGKWVRTEEVESIEEASKEGKEVMRSVRSSLKSMDLRQDVDSDKRVSGYKMSPSVKAAQAKSDALSKPVKRPQAGTLAALKKEEVTVETPTKGKKAAAKMTQKAAEIRKDKIKGSMNKVNMKPEMDITLKDMK